MKKNVMMRTASGLFIAVMLTTSIISGTLAKYTTSSSSSDKARVAKWGLGTATISIEDLFKPEYDGTVESANGDDVIAPGTKGEAEFKFECAGDAPEVAYKLTVSTEGSVCAEAIAKNEDIIWSLDGTAYDSFDDMLTAVQALGSDTDVIEPNNLPTGFGASDSHVISWEWTFEDADDIDAQDVIDTKMGDDAVTSDIEVTIVITVTATQVD